MDWCYQEQLRNLLHRIRAPQMAIAASFCAKQSNITIPGRCIADWLLEMVKHSSLDCCNSRLGLHCSELLNGLMALKSSH